MNELKTSNNQTNEKFILRLPDGMRSNIKDAAKRTWRSMNSEIICRLEQSFITPKEPANRPDLYPMLTPKQSTHTPAQGMNLSEENELEFVKLDKLERAMLNSFRQLPGHRKNSLLILLSN
ncbi:MAG: Arc family DNA-binding protein [Pseudomonadales bacterium]|nr:Arc family DNA-binding protein [Pseudomonadales bacterium]